MALPLEPSITFDPKQVLGKVKTDTHYLVSVGVGGSTEMGLDGKLTRFLETKDNKRYDITGRFSVYVKGATEYWLGSCNSEGIITRRNGANTLEVNWDGGDPSIFPLGSLVPQSYPGVTAVPDLVTGQIKFTVGNDVGPNVTIGYLDIKVNEFEI